MGHSVGRLLCRPPPPYSLQHMPIEVAAAEVGVCVTTFKKVCPASPLLQ